MFWHKNVSTVILCRLEDFFHLSLASLSTIIQISILGAQTFEPHCMLWLYFTLSWTRTVPSAWVHTSACLSGMWLSCFDLDEPVVFASNISSPWKMASRLHFIWFFSLWIFLDFEISGYRPKKVSSASLGDPSRSYIDSVECMTPPERSHVSEEFKDKYH